VTVSTVIDYTDALEKSLSDECVRPSLLHCTHDGLERRSKFLLTRQRLTLAQNAL
jgi:hypothetical protein